MKDEGFTGWERQTIAIYIPRVSHIPLVKFRLDAESSLVYATGNGARLMDSPLRTRFAADHCSQLDTRRHKTLHADRPRVRGRNSTHVHGKGVKLYHSVHLCHLEELERIA